MTYVFIINPAAGKGGQEDEVAKTIRDFFADREEKINIYLSKAPGDAIRYGKEYPIPDGEEVCFVACGGDGTFYETVNGAFGRPGACFAIYPCGSGNDFIKSVGGTKEDYFDLGKLVNGEKKVFDAISVNGLISSNICNIGIDSEICDGIRRYKKIPGVSGAMAYDISTVTTVAGGIFKGLGIPMKFTFDDGEVFSDRYMLSVFGNGQVYGGGYVPVPHADLMDGLIDFCAVKEASVLKVSSLLSIYKAGKHEDDPRFEGLLKTRRCRSCKVESEQELTVCLDGEVFKEKTLDIEMIPHSLPFIVPKFE